MASTGARLRPGRFLPPDPRAKTPYRLTPQMVFRIGILGFLVLVAFAILFFRLWALQVLSGTQHLQAAENNQLRTLRIEAARGPIRDRSGRVLVDNVRMLGASQRQLVRHVLVPSALTWIFSSLQASLGFAMVGAVVGEYLGSTRGLGYVISQAEGTFDTTGVFAGMTVLAIVVVAISAAVSRLERWLLAWKQ